MVLFITWHPGSSLAPSSSLLISLLFLDFSQVCSHLRYFILADPSAWNVLPPNILLAHSLTSYQHLVRSHFLSRPILTLCTASPNPTFTTHFPGSPNLIYFFIVFRALSAPIIINNLPIYCLMSFVYLPSLIYVS